MGWRILVASVCLVAVAEAQTYRLRVQETDGVGDATACCVGHTDRGDAVLVTAKHNVRHAVKIEIRVGRRWHKCKVVETHSDADVAVLEAYRVRLKFFAKIRPARLQERVTIGGYGAEYHGAVRREFDAIIRDEQTAVGVTGDRPLSGDSGGFVADSDGPTLLGIIMGYDRDCAATTVLVPADRVIECLQQRYQCLPSGCRPIWVRPGVSQPYFGPIPIGPPRPIGIVDPLPPIEITPPARPPVSDSPPGAGAGRPTQQQVDDAVSAWLDEHKDEIRGRDGRDGHPGKDGHAGPAGRSVRAEELNAIVDAWLDANRDSLRGDPGPPGQPGARGPAGLTGTPGTVDADQIRQLVRMEVEVLMAEIPDKPQVPTDELSERKRLLYFTSTAGCSKCKETDEMVRKLKDRGYPITRIDLDPRETEIKGVPRVFHPSSGRDVLGPQAVADYLASVGY